MSLSHAKAEWRHGDCQTSLATESDLGQFDPLRQFYAMVNRNGKWIAGATGGYRASGTPVGKIDPVPAPLALASGRFWRYACSQARISPNSEPGRPQNLKGVP